MSDDINDSFALSFLLIMHVINISMPTPQSRTTHDVLV